MNAAGDVLILLAVAAVGYVSWRWSLKRHPYAPCRWCADRRAGTNPGSSGERWGKCRHCGGNGRRLRWGARERE